MSKLPKLLSFVLSLFLVFPFFIFPVQSTDIITSMIPGYEDCYRDLPTINQTMEDLVSQYPTLVKLETIGFSYEDNPINVLTLSNQEITIDKPALILVSGLRANAFAPVELSLSFAEELLHNYGLIADSTWILDYLSLHLILLANPDGRLMAESQAQAGLDITWQNNTNLEYCSTEYGGVRLNQNFPFKWQPASCSPVYPGHEAGSELETQAITEFLEDFSLLEESVLLINLDAGENAIRMPYQYDFSVENPHQEELFTLAKKITYNSTSVPLPNLEPINYPSNGTLIDYAFGQLNIPSLDFKMGSDKAGSEVSYCWYYNDHLHFKNIQALLRAAKATIKPYVLPFGPETVIEEVNEDSTYLKGYADDYSYYHEGTDRVYSQIEKLYYSINTPPWDENAVLYPVDLVQDPDYDFYSSFEISIPKENLLPGQNIIFLQSWDSAENPDDSHPGLVSSVFIDIPYEIFLPMSLK